MQKQLRLIKRGLSISEMNAIDWVHFKVGSSLLASLKEWEFFEIFGSGMKIEMCFYLIFVFERENRQIK